MVCWLKFLKFVNDALKQEEPNLVRRKALAIGILKGIEKEEGHDIAKIEKRVKKEGKKGLILMAKKKRKRKDEENEEKENDEKEETNEENEECTVPEESW